MAPTFVKQFSKICLRKVTYKFTYVDLAGAVAYSVHFVPIHSVKGIMQYNIFASHKFVTWILTDVCTCRLRCVL